MVVTKEIADANPNDHAIVITSANYVAVRLREIPPMECLANADLVRSPTAVRFMASAMMNMNIKDFEILSNRFEKADVSAKIDIDPNWFNGSCIKIKDETPVYLVLNNAKRKVHKNA